MAVFKKTSIGFAALICGAISANTLASQSYTENNLTLASEAFNKSDIVALEELHDQGNLFATHMLVRCFEKGDACNISKDDLSANEYKEIYSLPEMMTSLMSLELRDDVNASNWVANYYDEKEGLEGKSKAFEIFKQNAEKGSAYAMYRLASFYYYGYSPAEKNLERAKYWFEKAADKSHVKAMQALAEIYDKGLGVSVDAEKSGQLMVQARNIQQKYAKDSAVTRSLVRSSGKKAVVTTYFATNRNVNKTNNINNKFGHTLSKTTYGSVNVSIPKDHRVGEIESSFLWFQEDPNKHVVFTKNSLKTYNKNAFYSKLSSQLNRTKTKKALVFIHGFNTTFEEAAKRTAQMTYDLRFDGVPVFYSWPARQTITPSLSNYRLNEKSIDKSIPQVSQFLDGVMAKTNAQEVYLIAHSMGNRALTASMVSMLKKNPKYGKRIKEVILAAPDVDADVFKTRVAPVIRGKLAKPVTIYSSSNDLALRVSSKVNGSRRLGDANGTEKIIGVENVDVSKVDSSLIGHSYYGENRSVLSDMVCLISKNKRATQRSYLKDKPVRLGVQWLFDGIGLSTSNSIRLSKYCR